MDNKESKLTSLSEEIYTMELQNLNGREDFEEAFRKGIEATLEYLIEEDTESVKAYAEEVSKQRAKVAVLEALEKEVPKAFKMGWAIGLDDGDLIDRGEEVNEMDDEMYYKTEVLPIYNK